MQNQYSTRENYIYLNIYIQITFLKISYVESIFYKKDNIHLNTYKLHFQKYSMQNQYSTRNITNKFMKIFYIESNYSTRNIKLFYIELTIFYVESSFNKENYKLYF